MEVVSFGETTFCFRETNSFFKKLTTSFKKLSCFFIMKLRTSFTKISCSRNMKLTTSKVYFACLWKHKIQHFILCNVGLIFKRDGKFVSIEQISTQELILKFTLKASLTNPTRTISA